MSVASAIILSRILAFDVIRAQFNRENDRCFLLKRAFDSSGFDVLGEIESGWFVTYSDFREQMQFEFATESEPFSDIFAQTSHIGYGVMDADDQIDVFTISERDKIPPSGTSPTWKCYGIREAGMRFTVI